MDQADHQQPEDATIINSAYSCFALLRPLVHQHQPGAEEHGEDRHHLGFKEHVIEEPDGAIKPHEAAAAERVFIRRFRPAEPDDIHRQDAQEREAAEHIHGEESLGRRDRLGPRMRMRMRMRMRELQRADVIVCFQHAIGQRPGLV